MNKTILAGFTENHIQRTLFEWREHLKRAKDLPKLFFELECNCDITLVLDSARAFKSVEPCRYSVEKHDGLVPVVTTDIPFKFHGVPVSDAFVRIKKFLIPAPTEKNPLATKNVFEAFLLHNKTQKTCELQNFILWW